MKMHILSTREIEWCMKICILFIFKLFNLILAKQNLNIFEILYQIYSLIFEKKIQIFLQIKKIFFDIF